MRCLSFHVSSGDPWCNSLFCWALDTKVVSGRACAPCLKRSGNGSKNTSALSAGFWHTFLLQYYHYILEDTLITTATMLYIEFQRATVTAVQLPVNRSMWLDTWSVLPIVKMAASYRDMMLLQPKDVCHSLPPTWRTLTSLSVDENTDVAY